MQPPQALHNMCSFERYHSMRPRRACVQGYVLSTVRRKLKAYLTGRSGTEIAALRASGEVCISGAHRLPGQLLAIMHGVAEWL